MTTSNFILRLRDLRLRDRYTREERLRLFSFALVALFAALVAIFLYYVIVTFQVYYPDWDEGDHGLFALRAAGFLQAGDIPGFLAHTATRTFQPFLHGWALAPVLLLFGTTLVTGRVFSMLSYVVASLVVWKLADKVSPRRGWLAGLVAATLMLLSVPMWLESIRIYLEPFGLLLVTLTLLAYVHSFDSSQRIVLAVTSVLAVLTLVDKYAFGIFLVMAIAANEMIAARFRPRRLLTARTLWLVLPYLAAAVLWEVVLPGQQYRGFFNYSTYSITGPVALPTLSAENLTFYPRSLIYQFSLTPLLGWLTFAGVVAAAIVPRKPKLQAISAYFWLAIIPLTIRPRVNIRFFYAVQPAAFIIAGYWAARLPDLIVGLRERLPKNLSVKDVSQPFHDKGLKPLVRHLRIDSKSLARDGVPWRAVTGVAVTLLLLGGVVMPAYQTLRGYWQTLPAIVAAQYDTDPLTMPDVHQFVVDNIPEDERQIFALYTSNNLNGWSLGWMLASQTTDGDIRQDVRVGNAMHNSVPEPSPEGDAEIRDALTGRGSRYLVVFLLGWKDHRQHDWNVHALNLREDLSFVATYPASTAIFYEKQTELLIDNRLSAAERQAIYDEHLKERPITVDIYHFEAGGFADEPLPEVVDLLDMPDIERDYTVPDPEVTLDADLDGRFKLLGYDTDVTEEGPSITLYWQNQGWSHDKFKVFVHLFDADGARVAQYDAAPLNWTYSTDQWAPGEVIAETITFDANDLPAGEYQYGVGMYPDPEGDTLPITLPDGTRIEFSPLMLPTVVDIS